MINCSGLGKNPCNRNRDSCMWLGKSKKCISIEELKQRSIAEKSAAHVALARQNAAITKAKRIEWSAAGGKYENFGAGTFWRRIPFAPTTPPLNLKFPESSRPDLDPTSWWGQCTRCGIRTTHTHPLTNLYNCPQCVADPEWSTRAWSTHTGASSFNKRSSRRRRTRRRTRRRSTRRRSTRRLRSRTTRSRKSKSRVSRRRRRH